MFVDEVVISIPYFQLYCAYKFRYDLHADSKIDEKKSDSKTFREYYHFVHGLKIKNPGPFLQCVQVGRNLNYLNWGEKSHAQSQSSNQIMIPEFVNIYPIPSSLVVQAQFLPSVIHRAMRLLLSAQLRLSVATETQWEAAMKHKGIFL